MVNVNMLTLSTPYQIEKTEILKISTINSVEITIEKEPKKVKNVFITNVLVPKIAVIRKEEGATAAASHLPSLSGQSRLSFVGPFRAVNIEQSKPSGKPH